jgi:hypothetical protein
VTAFFLTLFVLGASVVVIQFVLGIFGIGDDVDSEASDGLDLFTVRALSAAAAGFGGTGLGLMQWGVPGLLALPIAGVVGVAAAYGIALLMQRMRRLDVDKSFQIGMTIGVPAQVALSIPGARGGVGKVHLTAHSRFLELAAMTAEDTIPSGTPVWVHDTLSHDTVLVGRSPLILGDNDAQR